MKFKFRLAHLATLLLAFVVIVLPARAQKASLAEEDLIANCANQLDAYTEAYLAWQESRLPILIEQRDSYVPYVQTPGDNPGRMRNFEIRSKAVADKQALIAQLKKERSSRSGKSLGFGTAYESADFINNMDPNLLRSVVLGLRREMRSDDVSRKNDEWRLCTFSLRLALLDGKKIAPKTSTPMAVGQQRGDVSSASSVTSTCTNDITALQTQSQRWSGNANDVAARLGRMQKEMFEGRCASHPEAAAYIAGANKMLGYQTAAGSSAQPGALSGASQGKAGGASKEHNPVHEASNCIKIYGPAEMKALGMHGVMASKMVNSCPFSVSVTWCVASSATRRGDCNPGYSNLLDLSGAGAPGSNSYGVDAVDQTVRFAACKYGKDMGFLPVELDRQNPFRFACK